MSTLATRCHEAARRELPAAMASLGIEVSERQIDIFGRYCALLLIANSQFNLTAIDEPEDVMRRHFVDSLTALPALGQYARQSISVIDVGTGGGLPGLALAILRRHWQICLLDSVGKKAAFVAATAKTLELDNVEVVTDRVEAFGRGRGRDGFDLAIARAVAATPVLIEYCAPLVRAGGNVVLYKSGNSELERAAAVTAMVELNCRLASIQNVPPSLGVGEDRFLMLLEKTGPTPDRFPRRVGVAKARPLIGNPSSIPGSPRTTTRVSAD